MRTRGVNATNAFSFSHISLLCNLTMVRTVICSTQPDRERARELGGVVGRAERERESEAGSQGRAQKKKMQKCVRVASPLAPAPFRPRPRPE